MRQISTLLILFLTLICSLQISAQEAYLVKDINRSTNFGADVENLIEFKGQLFFSADTDTYGDELWVSDGTAAGTHLFVDIKSGSRSCTPKSLTVFNDKLYFRGDDDIHGDELWVTDGTPQGTSLVADIFPGAGDSGLSNITVYNNKLYFRANNGVNGRELWESDGTSAGTKMVKDIVVGSGSSGPNHLTVYGNKLYFSANDNTNGEELWVSDGTEAGTQLLKDINTSAFGSSYPSSLTVYNNKLYFTANDNSSDAELWESDGTEAGTKLSVNVNPIASSTPQELTVFNNKLYFRANFPSIGVELIETDGTPAGTKLVKDINPTGGSSPEKFRVFNNKLYFSANDGATGAELWVTDGTEAGTQLVKDIRTGIFGSNLDDPAVFGGQLFFSASSENGNSQLWVSDGTNMGTFQLLTIGGEKSTSSNARYFTTYNGAVYFKARDDINGTELWKTDGTEVGTQMVKDSWPGSSGSTGRMLGVMNGKLYFQGSEGVNGQELWETDGTDAGTKLVADINTGNGGSSPRNAVILNNKMYFRAYTPTYGAELWVSDGTEAGTQLVKDIIPGASSSGLNNLVVYNNNIYFSVYTPTYGTEIWVSDGTEAGTQLFADLVAGTSGANPRNFKVFDNKLYFRASDSTNGTELWVTDGTVGGTKIVKDIRSGSGGSGPEWFEVFNNKLYFKANDGIHGNELWETDGTEAGTKLAVDVREGSNSSSPSRLIVHLGRLYFRANDGISGDELWETDGTLDGTKLAADINPGSGGSSLDEIAILGNKMIFDADDGLTGEETWAFEPFDCTSLPTTTIYVSPTGVAANSGYSWAEATSLHQALVLANRCSSIEEIWVQQGTYTPGIDRIDTFSIPDNIKIYGGFNGTETSRTERDWVANPTYINGDIGIPNAISGNSFTLLTFRNTDNAIIDGFIIEEANAEIDRNGSLLDDTRGGGIYLTNANNNQIVNCIFRNNLGLEGAAVYHNSGTNNNYINCLFYGNEAQQTNPVFVEEGNSSFINCTFFDNTATTSHGILGTKDGTITFTNGIVEGNHALNFNTTGIGNLNATYSYLKGEHPSGTGNIDGTTITDVLFKDATNNDFTLQGNSPLVDIGNNLANTLSTDLGGNDRIIDGDVNTTATIDIGAYEFRKSEQVITFSTLPNVTYGDADFNVTATSDSGLDITYSSSDTSVATVSGNTVTIVGAGTTTITVSQAGNVAYLPALEVSQPLTVIPRPITLTADAGQNKVFGEIDPLLTYSITAGNLVAGDVLNGSLERTAGEDAGSYAINQGTLENSNYDITFVSADFEITKVDQIITFNPLTDVTYGDQDFEVNTTINSGLAIAYRSSNISVATISGNLITIVGAGSTTITASQAGDRNYNAAASVFQTLTVFSRPITVTADAGQSKVSGTADPVLTYSITSGNLVADDILNGSLERTPGEDAGRYAINQGTLDNANYDITFVSNDFEITKAIVVAPSLGLVKLYPNPAVDQIQIAEIPQNNRLSIYNVNGRLVKRIVNYSEEEVIDIAALPSGIYMLEISFFDFGNNPIIKKFIKN